MKHYCLHCGKELAEQQIVCKSCNHNSYLDMLENADKTIVGVLTAQQIEVNTQWVKYKCGKDGLAGHGYAAEDANALNDILGGNTVDLSGRSNDKFGPDRVVNGTLQIQTKYCANAKASVNAAFDKETGMYAYRTEDGGLQTLEVPSDQYEQAIIEMEGKISEGKVGGVTDSGQAKNIIKKGSVTYRQAKNITKAGNIDSLVFDAKTQIVSSMSAFGISFTINFGLLVIFHCKNLEDVKDAAKTSIIAGLQNGTINMTTGVLTSQLFKTQLGRNIAAGMQWAAKTGVDTLYQYKVGKDIVHKLAENLLGKSVYGGAAKQTLKSSTTKFLRTNAVTNIVLITVVSVPDAYRCIKGQISVPQFIKNLCVGSASVVGGTIGAVLGSRFGPAGSIILGTAGGAGSAWLSKKVADIIKKDDSERMYELIKVALLQLSHDYMIQSDDEFEQCIKAITSEKAIDTNLIRCMYSIGKDDDNDIERVRLAYDCLEYYFGAVIRRRKKLKLSGNQELLSDCINDLGNNLKD